MLRGLAPSAASAAAAVPSTPAFLWHQWFKIASFNVYTFSSTCLHPPSSPPPGMRCASSQAASPAALSSSTEASSSSNRESSLMQQTDRQPHGAPLHHVPHWSWRWVLGRQQSRKPAIKRPARHQWHYCNPNYDPQHPLPPKMLTPYTPPTNLHQDEWQIFRTQKQHHRQSSAERYRQQFVRWLALRNVDCRNAFYEVSSREVEGSKVCAHPGLCACARTCMHAYVWERASECGGVGGVDAALLFSQGMHTRTRSCASARAHTQIYTFTYMHTHIHTNTYIYTHVHTHTHICACAHIHACTYACTHHTHTHLEGNSVGQVKPAASLQLVY